MRDFTEETGIFIRNKTMSKSFKMKCISKLNQIIGDTQIIGLIIDDENFKGFRVFFNETEVVDWLLKRRYFELSGSPVFMYPLKTTLIVDQVVPKSDRDAESDLHALMEVNFGHVLAITNNNAYAIPSFAYFVDDGPQTWHVTVSVPEIEDLDVFKRKGSPRMTLDFPYMERKLEITFLCNKCEESGHTQKNCRRDEHPRKDSTSKNFMQMQSNPWINPYGPLVNPGLILPGVPEVKCEMLFEGDSSSYSEKPARPSVNEPIPSIKRCIRENSGVLSSEEMISFLSHVKGKSKLIDFARKYTSNVTGLKAQLKRVLSFYYKINPPESKEDTYYIKWLERLIERMEGDLDRNTQMKNRKSISKCHSKGSNELYAKPYASKVCNIIFK